MHDWRSSKLTKDYLEGVRGGIPLASIQIDIIIRIIKKLRPTFSSFIDLGCGDGILGRSLFLEWPETKGIFIDFSEPMLNKSIEKCNEIQNDSEHYLIDYGDDNWYYGYDSIQKGVDIVISGFSIHHQEDHKKYRLYQDIFQILNPGGVFLNLEHVASVTQTGEQLFDELFIDSLWDFQRKTGLTTSKEEVIEKYYNRDDKILNKLTLQETQCSWLRDIGFAEVDCFFKLYELALFGGQKPF